MSRLPWMRLCIAVVKADARTSKVCVTALSVAEQKLLNAFAAAESSAFASASAPLNRLASGSIRLTNRSARKAPRSKPASMVKTSALSR